LRIIHQRNQGWLIVMQVCEEIKPKLLF